MLDTSYFLFGFGKSERENIGAEQLRQLKKLAMEYLSLSDGQIRQLIREGQLIEVE